jgi:4-amino-4-deoxy-L-arabinose transferase-like glycosyltransferase
LIDLAANKPKSVNFALEFDGTATPVKTALFLLVVLCWLLPGLVGHDPWKPHEGPIMGVIHSILRHGDWLVPSLAGETYLERPPLYYWTAAIFAKLFSAVLAPHDGARLASGFYMALTIYLVARTGAKLMGPRFGRVTALIFMGSLGLLITAHMLSPDTAMLAATALMTFGLTWLPSQFIVAGLCFGTAIGMAFLAKGSGAAVLVLAMAAVPFLSFRAWRTRAYAQALGIGLLACLPWLLLWPLILYGHSPQLAMEWLWLHDWSEFSSGFSMASFGRLAYYLGLLPWYAWPALPLVCVTFWYGRWRLMEEPQTQLMMGLILGALLLLCFTGDTHEGKALPILIPLSLICASRIDEMRRGAASALDWFGMMTFGLLAVGMWAGWSALLFGFPQSAISYLQTYLPNYRLEFKSVAFVLAMSLTILWLISITRSRQSNRRAIVNWTAGITMFWMLAMTLWLPFIDEGKSYRAMTNSLKQALPVARNCVASRGLGEAQRAMLDYFIDLRTRRLELTAGNNCRFLLTQGVQTTPTFEDGEDWRLVWEGARPGDRVELYRLYQRRKK